MLWSVTLLAVVGVATAKRPIKVTGSKLQDHREQPDGPSDPSVTGGFLPTIGVMDEPEDGPKPPREMIRKRQREAVEAAYEEGYQDPMRLPSKYKDELSRWQLRMAPDWWNPGNFKGNGYRGKDEVGMQEFYDHMQYPMSGVMMPLGIMGPFGFDESKEGEEEEDTKSKTFYTSTGDFSYKKIIVEKGGLDHGPVDINVVKNDKYRAPDPEAKGFIGKFMDRINPMKPLKRFAKKAYARADLGGWKSDHSKGNGGRLWPANKEHDPPVRDLDEDQLEDMSAEEADTLANGADKEESAELERVLPSLHAKLSLARKLELPQSQEEEE